MNPKRNYSLSEAARLIGVPRTTINDWISKHANYLHFEMNGRRKALTDSGLEVLREINSLRDAGLSATEIELRLAENHPVKADEVTDSAKPSDAPTVSSNDAAEYAVMVKRQTDEIGTMLGEHLQNLATRLEEAENEQKMFSRRMIKSVVMTVLTMLLIPALMLIFVGIFYRSMQQEKQALKEENKNSAASAMNLEKENFKLLRDLKDDTEKIKGKESEISRLSIMLDSRQKDYERNVNKLQQQLDQQKKDFAAMLEEKAKNAATKHEAEMAKMRDEFAGKQLEKLKKLEKLEKDLKDKEEIIADLSSTSKSQAKIIREQATAISKVVEERKIVTEPAKTQPAEAGTK